MCFLASMGTCFFHLPASHGWGRSISGVKCQHCTLETLPALGVGIQNPRVCLGKGLFASPPSIKSCLSPSTVPFSSQNASLLLLTMWPWPWFWNCYSPGPLQESTSDFMPLAPSPVYLPPTAREMLCQIHDRPDLPQAFSQPHERDSVLPFLGKEIGSDGEITYPYS